MAVFVLTIIISVLIGAAIWFVLGSRFGLSDDERLNELLNFIAFVIGVLPVAFVLVFFGLGGL
jgi:hypothetical protein